MSYFKCAFSLGFEIGGSWDYLCHNNSLDGAIEATCSVDLKFLFPEISNVLSLWFLVCILGIGLSATSCQFMVLFFLRKGIGISMSWATLLGGLSTMVLFFEHSLLLALLVWRWFLNVCVKESSQRYEWVMLQIWGGYD